MFGDVPEDQRVAPSYRRGKQLPIRHTYGPESRMVEIVGGLMRLAALRLTVLGLVVVALSGCGSDERALKLPVVKEALHAAGLGRVHVLTARSANDELRSKGFTDFTSGPAPDGPDYLQGQARPELMIVRFGRVSEASKAVPRSRTERSEGLTIELSRACNVAAMARPAAPCGAA